jgi:hypothetical protein
MNNKTRPVPESTEPLYLMQQRMTCEGSPRRGESMGSVCPLVTSVRPAPHGYQSNDRRRLVQVLPLAPPF